MENVTIELPAEITYSVSALSEDRTLEVGKVPVESIVKLLTYGVTQYVADGAAVDVHERDDDGKHVLVNGAKVKRPEADVSADKIEGVKARLAAIVSGVFKTGGGGRSLSDHEVELRAMIAPMLVERGWIKADAKKLAAKPREAVQAMVKRHCKIEGIKVGSDLAKTLFTDNWGAIDRKVKANLSARGDLEGVTL